MDCDPPNPYVDARLGELEARASELAGKLLKGEKLGRRDLAYLLMVMARRLAPERAHPNSPHRVVSTKECGALEAYWPVYERLLQEARHYVLTQAVDAAGESPVAINRYVHGFGIPSDDALRGFLEDLDARRAGSTDDGQHLVGMDPSGRCTEA